MQDRGKQTGETKNAGMQDLGHSLQKCNNAGMQDRGKQPGGTKNAGINYLGSH